MAKYAATRIGITWNFETPGAGTIIARGDGLPGKTAEMKVQDPELLGEILIKTLRAVQKWESSILLEIQGGAIVRDKSSPADCGILDQAVRVALESHDQPHEFGIEMIRDIVSKIPGRESRSPKPKRKAQGKKKGPKPSGEGGE